MNRQNGLSLTGLLAASGVVVAIAVLVTKVMPSVTEYFTVVRHVKQIASGGDTSSVAAVRKAYALRSAVDETPSVTAEDLEISKEGNDVVISFAYSKKIPLFGNVSLLIDFAGRSGGAGGKRLSGV